MSINLTSPITGSAQTGLTGPTYTIVDDLAPDSNGRQKAVSALGGTQTGVAVHSASNPFTVTAYRPKAINLPGLTDPVTGQLRNRSARNQYAIITRKGVLPLAGQNPEVMIVTTTVAVPAGAESADPNSVRAALSAHIGALNQQSAGIGDTAISAIL